MIELRCKSCGGALDVDNSIVVTANGETRIRDGQKVICPHCGAQYLTNDVLSTHTVVNVSVTNVSQAPAEVKAAENAKSGRGVGRYLVVAIAVFFVAMLGYGLITAGDQRVTEGKAPDFTLTTFDGETLRLSDLQGQVVVLNFWATWCISCKDEAVDLELAWRDFKDQGVLFIGVDYLDQEPLNLQWLERYGITYPNGPDIQGRIYNSYGVQGLPETFIIDQNGNVTKVFVGPTTRSAIAAEVRRLLAGETG